MGRFPESETKQNSVKTNSTVFTTPRGPYHCDSLKRGNDTEVLIEQSIKQTS